MITYYETHPYEIPPSTALHSQTNKSKNQNTDTQYEVKQGLSRNDVFLALGISFGVTFAVVAILYIIGV